MNLVHMENPSVVDAWLNVTLRRNVETSELSKVFLNIFVPCLRLQFAYRPTFLTETIVLFCSACSLYLTVAFDTVNQQTLHGRLESEFGFKGLDYINARARFSYQLDCTGSTTYRHLLSSSLISAKSFRDNHDDCVFPETMVLLWLESEDPLPVPSSSSSQIFIMTFNMNQWYLSGMPARWEDSRFMQIHHLGMLAQLLLNQHILHVSVGEKPASYYLDGNNQAFRTAPDYARVGNPGWITRIGRRNYRALLAGLTCITGQKIVHISLTSEFTQFIKHLEKVGIGLLKDLDQVLNLCIRYNLLNSLEFPADEDGQVIKHKALLTVLMRLRKEKLLIDFIHCSLLSNADQSCMDVETLAEWALQSVELTCETFNSFMHPIFEYGSLNVDDHSMDTTDQCVNSFNLLINFITSLLTCCSNALSLQTCEALKSRLCVSFLMEDYMQASIWTVTCLFLHHSHGSNTFEKLKTDCLDGYGKRRASRRLLIDYIMNCNDNGSNKFDRYEDDEEMINDGKHATLQKYLIECQQKPVYPLASINTLLGVYLLWDVSMATKHAILMYFTRDVLHEHKKCSLSLSYKLLDSKMDVSSQKLFLEVLLSNNQYKHLCLRVIQIIINNNLVTNIQQAEGLKRMIVGVDCNLSSTAFRFTIQGFQKDMFDKK
ncbi:hypothetical protein HELRODRAFT_190057 [Helobdella robusta]|uniref:Uncharacterized protein n=1 Tax=Helobdella robusta TaxID=6412 RepID=T1FRM7_HELRO|nr:hypothetical protein HELRODRAFT_190057 [Helobdella robusta]ESO11725.1 hypothetical protein HELRODRAFT_190057 [Helobdella robusta]